MCAILLYITVLNALFCPSFFFLHFLFFCTPPTPPPLLFFCFSPWDGLICSILCSMMQTENSWILQNFNCIFFLKPFVCTHECSELDVSFSKQLLKFALGWQTQYQVTKQEFVMVTAKGDVALRDVNQILWGRLYIYWLIKKKTIIIILNIALNKSNNSPSALQIIH